MASSGIAATLLEGGRTAHNRFRLPINNPEEKDYCVLSRVQEELICRAGLIVWDEIVMAQAYLELLDKTCQRVRGSGQTSVGSLLSLGVTSLPNSSGRSKDSDTRLVFVLATVKDVSLAGVDANVFNGVNLPDGAKCRSTVLLEDEGLMDLQHMCDWCPTVGYGARVVFCERRASEGSMT